MWIEAMDASSALTPAGRRRKMAIAAIVAVAAVAGTISVILFAEASSTPTTASTSNHTVPLDKIVSGGPPRDGIPSIDNPKFISVSDASRSLKGSDLVIGLQINGEARAYPLGILVWHEIVNDIVGGTPVAVTYCPICFTVQVYERTLEGKMVEFGTSGKLYNSNLVMYDRTSESLWSQALGKAIVGKYAGTELRRIPFDLAKWNDWKELYPEAKVLSTDTGFWRPYSVDPYGNYLTSGQQPYLPAVNHDTRMAFKEIMIGLEHDNVFKAYKVADIEEKKVVNDEVNGKKVVLVSLRPFMVRVFEAAIPTDDDNGTNNNNESNQDQQSLTTLEFEYDRNNNLFIDKQTGSRWNFDGKSIEGSLKGIAMERASFDEGFWFSWTAFHPQTLVYKSSTHP